MVKRQFPNPKALPQFKKPTLNGKKRRLDSALTIYDLQTIAKRRTLKGAFDYTAGSAECDLSLARARQAFENIQFHRSILGMSPSSTRPRSCSAEPRRCRSASLPSPFTSFRM